MPASSLTSPDELLSSRQVDTRYRLRHGTAAKAALSGQVRSIIRRRGAAAPVILIRASRAEALWGEG